MTSPADLIPIAQLRRSLCENIGQLSKNDRQAVLDFCVQELPFKKIHAAGDGCRISLDASVPDDLIRKIHNLIQSKLVFFDESELEQKS